MIDVGPMDGRHHHDAGSMGLVLARGYVLECRLPAGLAHLCRETTMLVTLAIILLILWALGFLAFHVAGGLIHLLLVVAVIVIVVRLVQGRRPV